MIKTRVCATSSAKFIDERPSKDGFQGHFFPPTEVPRNRPQNFYKCLCRFKHRKNGNSVTRSQWSKPARKWLQLSLMTHSSRCERPVTSRTINTLSIMLSHRPLFYMRKNTWANRFLSGSEYIWRLLLIAYRHVARYSLSHIFESFVWSAKKLYIGRQAPWPVRQLIPAYALALSFGRTFDCGRHTCMISSLDSTPDSKSSVCMARIFQVSYLQERMVSAVHGRQFRAHIPAAPL